MLVNTKNFMYEFAEEVVSNDQIYSNKNSI